MSETTLNRVPPQNLEAEQSVLAAILLENHAIDVAGDEISPDDFYKLAHKLIYEAMLDLTAASEPIDLTTLAEIMRKRGELERVGGNTYLSRLADVVPNAANVKYHCKIVHEKAILRNLISHCSEILTRSFEQPEDTYAHLMDAERRIYGIAEDNLKAEDGYVTVTEAARRGYDRIEKQYEKRKETGSATIGIPTGFRELDRLIYGFQPGNVLLVAGRPSMGKTALALNFCENVAIRQEVPTAFFSLEMDTEELMLRLYSSLAHINSREIMTGSLDDAHFTRLAKAAGIIKDKPLYIFNPSRLTPMELRMRCRRLKREHGLEVVVLDYLQLMSADSPKDSRQDELEDISRQIKGIARELQVAMIPLCQLNRELHKRLNTRPTLADLKGSGALEQDADIVMFPYREFVHDRSKDRNAAEIIIEKFRNGETGSVKLTYVPEFTLFAEPTAIFV